ncbi:hypothetical protein [Saccharopolyspora sp. NPDC050642]|uniref:hypothetical protein n=1 Tax=Saccharopolyspora sp. NPDC050642 TaxID=3157099 RepID=UPI0033D9A260
MKHLGIAGAAATTALLLGQPASAAGAWTEEPFPAQPADAVLQSAAAGDGEAWSFGVLNREQDPDLHTLAFRRGEQGWEQVPTPDIGRTNAATVVGRDDVWVVGDGKSMHWNGAEWREVPVVAPPEVDTQLFDVSAIDPDDVWTTGLMPELDGEGGRNTVQRWNGDEWAEVPVPQIGGMLYGIGGTEANDIWAVGLKGVGTGDQARTAGAALHWDGRQWQESPSLEVPGWWVSLEDVLAVAPDDVWAVGDRSSDRESYPFVAHWDGTRWSAVETPNEQCRLREITQGPDVLWAIGYAPDGPCVLRHDGTNWQRVPGPSGPQGMGVSTNGGAVLDDGRLMVTGFAGNADVSQPFAATYGG